MSMSDLPHYSVEQLLHARQSGIPDYVVVPLLQKAVAEKQAMQQQQAMQPQPQQPPIAHQILGAAQQVAQQDAGIKALEGYANGGVMHYAEGMEVKTPTLDSTLAPYMPSKEELDPEWQIEKRNHLLRENPVDAAAAKYQTDKQQEIDADKARAPWLSLMKAGTSMMAGTSPFAMTNIGKGLSEGVDDYASRAHDISSSEDKLKALQMQLAQAKRAVDISTQNSGFESAATARHLAIQGAVAEDLAKAKVEIANQREQGLMTRDQTINPVEGARLNQGAQNIAIRQDKAAGAGNSTQNSNREIMSLTSRDNALTRAITSGNTPSEYLPSMIAEQQGIRSRLNLVTHIGGKSTPSFTPHPITKDTTEDEFINLLNSHK